MGNDNNTTKGPQSPSQGFVLNEKGEEIPITDEMVTEAMKDIKLQSIGAHTGFTKAITDYMLPEKDRENK